MPPIDTRFIQRRWMRAFLTHQVLGTLVEDPKPISPTWVVRVEGELVGILFEDVDLAEVRSLKGVNRAPLRCARRFLEENGCRVRYRRAG